MKITIQKTFPIAVGLVAAIASSSVLSAETLKPGVNVKQVVASQLVTSRDTSGGFAWDRAENRTSTETVAQKKSTGFRWETTKSDVGYASLDSSSARFSEQPQSQTQGFIWGIRSAGEQKGFIWGIRNSAEQKGFIWGIRNSAEQKGFIWGIRNSADQKGFLWGLRNSADQSGFIWGIRSATDQQGFIWGIRNAAEQQGFIWGIRGSATQSGFIWGIR